MPVTPTTGLEPEYSDSLSQATHLLTSRPAPPPLPGPAFRAPEGGTGIDNLPPLPLLNDTAVHLISEEFTAAALDQAGLTASREVDERAERQLLWRLMTQAEDQVFIGGESVPDEVFSQPMRVTIMGYMRELFAHHQSVSAESVWTLANERARESIHFQGVVNELQGVFQAMSGRSVEELLSGLKRTFRARAIGQLIFREASRRFEEGEDVDKLISGIEELVIELGQQGRSRRRFSDIVRAVHKQIVDPDKTKQGLALGLKDFDRQFGGIKRDRVITIGGYTGSGKTALVIDFIYRLLYYHKDKIAIKFFSFEMSEERVVQRLFSRAAGVSVKRQDDWWVKVKYDRDDDGNEVEVPLMEPLNDDELRRLNQALPFLEGMDDVIDVEYGTYTAEEAKRECRRHKLKNKDKHCIYFFDHLGLFDKDGNDNRVQFDNIMNNCCKDVARTLDSTVFPLVQLAKTVESRFNKADYYRPTSSDIMESVGVEAASDIVLLLWRPSKYFERIPYIHPDLNIFTNDEDPESAWWDCRHRMIGVVAKNRDGAAFNDVVFDADMAHSKLYNYDRLRRDKPELFNETPSLFTQESYLTGESGGAQYAGPQVVTLQGLSAPPPILGRTGLPVGNEEPPF